MSAIVIPVSLMVAGTVITAGHAAFNSEPDDGAAWRRMVRATMYVGLVALLAASERLVWTAFWIGAPPSLGLAYYVWFGRRR
jgi:hypothetical protein